MDTSITRSVLYLYFIDMFFLDIHSINNMLLNEYRVLFWVKIKNWWVNSDKRIMMLAKNQSTNQPNNQTTKQKPKYIYSFTSIHRISHQIEIRMVRIRPTK